MTTPSAGRKIATEIEAIGGEELAPYRSEGSKPIEREARRSCALAVLAARGAAGLRDPRASLFVSSPSCSPLTSPTTPEQNDHAPPRRRGARAGRWRRRRCSSTSSRRLDETEREPAVTRPPRPPPPGCRRRSSGSCRSGRRPARRRRRWVGRPVDHAAVGGRAQARPAAVDARVRRWIQTLPGRRTVGVRSRTVCRSRLRLCKGRCGHCRDRYTAGHSEARRACRVAEARAALIRVAARRAVLLPQRSSDSSHTAETRALAFAGVHSPSMGAFVGTGWEFGTFGTGHPRSIRRVRRRAPLGGLTVPSFVQAVPHAPPRDVAGRARVRAGRAVCILRAPAAGARRLVPRGEAGRAFASWQRAFGVAPPKSPSHG